MRAGWSKAARNPNAGRHHPAADEAELVAANLDIAYAVARNYHFPGATGEDVRQEALVGLLIGIREFDPAVGTTLRCYLGLSVRMWLTARLIAHTREKQRPLSEAARIAVNEEGEPCQIIDLLPGGRDPLELLIARERFAEIVDGWKGLSELERRTMLKVVNGEPMHAGAHDKQADNAVQRARRKLRAAA